MHPRWMSAAFWFVDIGTDLTIILYKLTCIQGGYQLHSNVWTMVLDPVSTYLQHVVGAVQGLLHSCPSLCPFSLFSSRNISMYFRQRRDIWKFWIHPFAILPSAALFIHCFRSLCLDLFINPYPTAFPYGNGMVLHFYQQQESSTTKTVHKVINKGLKTYV